MTLRIGSRSSRSRSRSGVRSRSRSSGHFGHVVCWRRSGSGFVFVVLEILLRLNKRRWRNYGDVDLSTLSVNALETLMRRSFVYGNIRCGCSGRRRESLRVSLSRCSRRCGFGLRF